MHAHDCKQVTSLSVDVGRSKIGSSHALVSLRLRNRKADSSQLASSSVSPSPVNVTFPKPHLVREDEREPSHSAGTQIDTLARLSREVRHIETSSRNTSRKQAISTGCKVLDAQLPSNGYVPGSVVEYLRSTSACGASYLAFAAAASAMRATGGFLVIVDALHNVYPPALACHGIELEKVVFVRPHSHTDALWAIDQALRTPAVASVITEMERIDDRSARRLQLAAEEGNGLALLLRSAVARKQPSWAEIQWLVRSMASAKATACSANPYSRSKSGNRQLLVQLARVRGGKAGKTTRLEIDSASGQIRATTPEMRERNRHESKAIVAEKSALHLASELASAKNPSRSARAG